MPVHDWARVSAGTFHDFHVRWIAHLAEALNDGRLPPDYYALAEQRAGQIVPDVLTLTAARVAPREAAPAGAVAVAETPPKVSRKMAMEPDATYVLARRTLAIHHASNHQVVALVEIVSPGNKNRAAALHDFVDKALSAMKQGIHVLVVDLHAPGPHDPDGIHGAIWDELLGSPYRMPADKPLTLVAYAVDRMPTAYVEPLAVGTVLPDMPLFLTPEHYVNVPLEETYMATYRGVPSFWREVIEGRRPAPAEGEA